jgi:hypothetical protein
MDICKVRKAAVAELGAKRLLKGLVEKSELGVLEDGSSGGIIVRVAHAAIGKE